MLEFEVLVRELGAINTLATCTITLGEVTPLNHELFDHTVEGRAFIAKPFLASSESTEVLGGL